KLLLDLIKEYGTQFKVSFSLSGVYIKQLELYAPEVLESFKALAKTGCVEFLAETYSHSLVSLRSQDEFVRQVEKHAKKIEKYFGQKPQVFRNTELVYSDEIGRIAYDMGFKAVLTEGARHILGWKSPNFLYYNAINPKLKVLLRNYKLSDDIAFRFSNKHWDGWPLTADKFVDWLNQIPENEEVVNLFMDYETFGEHQWEDTGIFKFMRSLPAAVFKKSNFKFLTPSEVADKLQPVAAVNVPYHISWADEERDLTAWLGNEMQYEAFNKINDLENLVKKIDDPEIQKDWQYLQTSDHFYYMCTKFFADGDVHMYFNPFKNPYDAFINYMNVVSDFIIRVEKASKTGFGDDEPKNKEEIENVIKKYQSEIERLKQKMEKIVEEDKILEKKKTTKKTTTKETAKKATTKTITTKKELPAKKTKTTKKETPTKKPATSKKTTTKKSENTKKT
ncbi:MAG TPA: alpha-amylase, partial [Bacteroidetes bacterium]|nr:alpha-amylase [Bacteroidota bacterium]